MNTAVIWETMRKEAQQASEEQPLLASFFHANILNHESFISAISFFMSHQLASDTVPPMIMRDMIYQAIEADADIERRMLQDLWAYYDRDPACQEYITPFLYFKGYHAIQAYRVAHQLWNTERQLLATYIQSRCSELYDVDIHPAAQIAGGLMIDHATGVVIGETTVIKENVSMLHAVTLGGSGSQKEQRHPTIESGVLISVGAKILGNITIGQGVKVGAGSVVMESVAANSTVVGVPARVVGRRKSNEKGAVPALAMEHQIDV
jgi:serine O-acetyltransferase